MCTAILLHTKDHYFGRNLDLEYHYNEQVVVCPRRFPLFFRRLPPLLSHHAMIGMATLSEGFPLFYDATNEHGVSIAGLHFPDWAQYFPYAPGKDNAAPFELIPWILGQCETMRDVRALLARIHLLDEPFSKNYPLTPLHFMIAWQDECIVLESTPNGAAFYDNPAHVLTNSPPLDMQLWYLSRYQSLSPCQPDNAFAPDVPLPLTSGGMGALGLPGDLSSPSRFVRAAYTLRHSQCKNSEEESVSQFFHILSSVAHTRGSALVDGKPEITVYSSCCNADRGIYYYTTYGNSAITAVDMRRENLDGETLAAYPLRENTPFYIQN